MLKIPTFQSRKRSKAILSNNPETKRYDFPFLGWDRTEIRFRPLNCRGNVVLVIRPYFCPSHRPICAWQKYSFGHVDRISAGAQPPSSYYFPPVTGGCGETLNPDCLGLQEKRQFVSQKPVRKGDHISI